MPHCLAKRHNITMSGEGPVTLLFLHGLGCDQSVWRQVAPAFERYARVLRMDLAGCGGADPAAWDSGRHATLAGHAADVVEVASRYAGDRTVLVGHSVGAMIGMLADLQAPWLFDAHAMVATSPCYLHEPDYRGGFDLPTLQAMVALIERDPAAWVRLMTPQLLGPVSPALAQEFAAAVARTHPRALAQLAGATFLSDLRPQPPQLTKPVMLLQCSEDALVPAGVGRAMEALLPDCTLRQLRNQGHCPQLTNPAHCADALSHFVMSLGLGFERPQETYLGDLEDTGWGAAAF